MLRQQSPNMNPALLDSFVRPEMVLDGLVNEQLILSAAEQSKLVFSTNQVSADVRQIELFQEDGKFSNNRFERELRSRGMSPQGYIRGLQQDMVKEQYRAGFMATNFALPSSWTSSAAWVSRFAISAIPSWISMPCVAVFRE